MMRSGAGVLLLAFAIVMAGQATADSVSDIQQAATDMVRRYLLDAAKSPNFTKPIPLLYNTSAFFPQPKATKLPAGASNPIPTCCPAMTGSVSTASVGADAGCGVKSLKASASTGHWGYWYEGLQPSMVVKSGDIVDIEMPTFGANSAWELMGQGDPGMEDMYAWDTNGPRVAFKGPTGTTGGHFLTGPVYVCGAEPGDVLQVDILDLIPRPNPGANNRSVGFTSNGGIGWWNRVGYVTPSYKKDRGGVVVYEAIKDQDGRPQYWTPLYTYDGTDPRIIKQTPGCVPQTMPIPRTTESGYGIANNTDYKFAGKVIPCVNNTQDWTYPNGAYSGQVYIVPEEARDYSINGTYRLPVNMHIGNMGLAPATGVPVITAPPMRSGGNLDDKRIGIGATMYYPIEVAGALLSMGDCHGHQGDGESAATGVETSLNGRFKLTLHKASDLKPPLSLVDYPLLENANEYVIHGYAYKDWIREIPNPQVNVSQTAPYGGVDLNRAMSVIYNQTREFVMVNYNMTEDLAINILSHIDFGITQIVDSNVGLHSMIPKWMFNTTGWEAEPYYQAKVKTGTSRTFYP
ncbi:hypothetical protein WJX72_001972 [[Myrmecia] bisecta]|uniref:Acetamidase n=1 Tax=[Myrmecia] bisecta TaxID=41462 RepID=A0AAW1R452_9CHLO